MSHKDSDGPKAFLIWNRHHKAPTTVVGKESPLIEGLARLNFVYGSEVADYSPLMAGDFIPSSQASAELDELGEKDCAISMPNVPIYNIVQNKMNLCEKRGPKFACLECRYLLHTRLSMVTHMKTHRRPFCEVCFNMFDSKEAVHCHIESLHPEVVIRESSPSASQNYYCLQTVAPPNTPNPMSDDEMATIEELLNPIVKVPVNVAAVQKLLCADDTDGGASTEDEHRLVIDNHLVAGSSRGRPKARTIIKRPKKKKINKVNAKDVKAAEDTVMKKITSRFGRSISLKIPQY